MPVPPLSVKIMVKYSVQIELSDWRDRLDLYSQVMRTCRKCDWRMQAQVGGRPRMGRVLDGGRLESDLFIESVHETRIRNPFQWFSVSASAPQSSGSSLDSLEKTWFRNQALGRARRQAG